jgi:phospholipid/cholesterol/gamma-HCH transport system substrate-binding protein
VLQGGEELRGEDPPRLDQLIARMDKLATTVSDLFAGTDGQGSEVTGFLHDAAHLTRDVDGLLTENRATLTATLKDVHDAASNLKVVAQQGRALLENGKVRGIVDDASAVAANLRENVPPTLADAREAAHHANDVAGSFSKEDVAKLREAIAQYERAGASLESIANRADKILAEVDAGKGSIGPLLKDDSLYKDLRGLVHDLKAHPWKVLWKN